jgi:hypothetical protein
MFSFILGERGAAGSSIMRLFFYTMTNGRPAVGHCFFPAPLILFAEHFHFNLPGGQISAHDPYSYVIAHFQDLAGIGTPDLQSSLQDFKRLGH